MAKDKQEICMKCNIYHVVCMGEQFKEAFNRDGGVKRDCANREFSPGNTPNRLQVDAFVSLNRRKILNGMTPLNAFVEAIVQTSDDVFATVSIQNRIAIRERLDRQDKKYRAT